MAKQSEYYYLFPDPELRKEAEKLSKDYGIQLVCSAIASAVMAIVIICICCTGWVFQVRLLGFACPISICEEKETPTKSIFAVISKRRPTRRKDTRLSRRGFSQFTARTETDIPQRKPVM